MPVEPLAPTRYRVLIAWVSVAMAVHVLFLVVALMFPGRFGYSAKHKVSGDILIYHGFATPFLKGQLAYRDYQVEYPILAMPVFLAALVVGGDFERYRTAFITEMMLVDAALVFLIARRTAQRWGMGRVPSSLAWYTAYFLSLCPLVVTRFDLVPTFLGFVAALAITSGRMGVGGFAAGLGVLAKIVPGVVMVPLLAIPGPWKPRGRGLGFFVGTIVVGVSGWWLLSGDGLLWLFRYHGERGLEIGSLPASAYLAAHKLFGVLIAITFQHGGVNVGGPGARDAARLSPIVQGALLLLVAGKARASQPEDGLRLAAAALLAFMIAGKVLSPQYMIWLLPFITTIEGPKATAARWLFLACCLLTTILYPYQFEALCRHKTWSVICLVIRNLGLVWLFALLISRRSSLDPLRESV